MPKPKFPIYKVDEFEIFRGLADKNTWFIYDTKREKYTGGSFDTLKDAKKYAARVQ